ncbi:hypothetical protein STEG23_016124, partial [Scotinomys teguina]
EPVTFEDVAVKFTLEEWSLMNSSQKKLYSVVMKGTFLNLISIGKTQEEKFGDDCKAASLIQPWPTSPVGYHLQWTESLPSQSSRKYPKEIPMYESDKIISHLTFPFLRCEL